MAGKYVKCDYCEKSVWRNAARIREMERKGWAEVYCGIKCLGDARRKTDAEKKETQRAQKKRYWQNNKVKKQEYEKARYQIKKASDPLFRKRRALANRKYKASEKGKYYSQKFYSVKEYGTYWESHRLLQKLESLILT